MTAPLTASPLHAPAGPLRRAFVSIWMIAACEAPPESTEETGVTTTSTRWQLGSPTACEAPVPLGWADRSDLLAGSDARTGVLDELGSVSITEDSEGWRVLTAGRDDPRILAEGRLDGQGLTDLPLPTGAQRGRFTHLDDEEEPDLLVWGDGAWILPHADPNAAIRVVEPDATRPIVDIEVGDFDGDAAADLLGVWHDDNEIVEGERYSPPFLVRGGPDGFGAREDVLPDDAGWGAAFDLTALDWDGDADLDAYLCHDGPATQPNRAVCEVDGALAICDPRGADVQVFCMGTTVGDVNGDALPDLYVTAVGEHRLLLGSDAGFYDAATSLAPMVFDTGEMGWGSAIVDMDNDGQPEILAAMADFTPGPGRWPLWVLRTSADGGFEERGAEWGFPRAAGGRAVLAHDLNADGVVDVIMGDMERPPWVFLSEGCTTESWIEVDAPHGTWVEVEAGGRVWGALATEAPGFSASGPARVHIGLGANPSADAIRVRVPGFGEDVLRGPVEARQRVRWAPAPDG